MVIILPDSSSDQELSHDEFIFMIQQLKDSLGGHLFNRQLI